MSQKITITTKIQKGTGAIDKVEYQWHWNRIVLVCFSLVVISACIIWALSSGVSANETLISSQEKERVVTHKVVPIDNHEKAKTIELAQIKDQPVVILDDKNEIEEKLAPEIVKAVEVQHKDINTQALEVKKVDEPKDTVLRDTQVMHVSTLIPQSHLSKISHGGSIDTDFVTRAVLTTAVVNKEPVDVLNAQVSLFSIEEKLFFFTEVNNMKSQTVFHRWFFENTLMAEVELDIFSTRYRTYSSKKIMTKQSGNWRVELVNSNQNILASKSFHIK
ncbi:DUF2914 domain-containing protein [Pseudoalteromonas sp. C2R02]|uniref:DUF2914 domain-containing protein n=1 Tax=Pseudoalteromonas sp. C2R02 TaxID=2841565 RepID=UPI001C088AC4|nr:DUF2914 domain-containing protein [Pseudoalteromonas sp. C2R02]